jgi:hypothetical protein
MQVIISSTPITILDYVRGLQINAGSDEVRWTSVNLTPVAVAVVSHNNTLILE